MRQLLLLVIGLSTPRSAFARQTATAALAHAGTSTGRHPNKEEHGACRVLNWLIQGVRPTRGVTLGLR